MEFKLKKKKPKVFKLRRLTPERTHLPHEVTLKSTANPPTAEQVTTAEQVATAEQVTAPEQITSHDITYSELIEVNPVVEDLVSRLGLVVKETGATLKKVDLRQAQHNFKPLVSRGVEVKKTVEKKGRKLTLENIANAVMEAQNNYKKSTIIKKIKDLTGVSKERAESGFNLLLEKNLIKYAHLDLYYLANSTPF